jgi:hypothetical protein
MGKTVLGEFKLQQKGAGLFKLNNSDPKNTL